MSDLNSSQRAIAETLDGMIVVDAGPGTGKTHTIVERYVNLISQEGVEPGDVLLMTFTRNAATEMETRIKGKLNERRMSDEAKRVQVKTFDSFCLSVVMDSPETAGRMFGFDSKLTHSVRLIENETLNTTYFRSFLDEYLNEFGEGLGEWGAVMSQVPSDLYKLINRLMSKGIYPLRRGWFGGDDGRDLLGDDDAMLGLMREKNKDGKYREAFNRDFKPGEHDRLDFDYTAKPLPDEMLVTAARDDRSGLIEAVRDIYWHYIDRCVRDDRLTFGICAMLAFSVLYDNRSLREANSYRYVMIDEFQDTNASQLMMTLMILKEPNLCMVGDWKQGIYGFRYVSTDNILRFEERAVELRRALNDDLERVRFTIPEPVMLQLDVNYRSSQLVVDSAFHALRVPATSEESFHRDRPLGKPLSAFRDGEIGDMTHVRIVPAVTRKTEARKVADCVRDYVGSGSYPVADGGVRPMRLGDIAVLCRTGKGCRDVLDELTSQGIPAYLQGDVEVMSTREGKLALAWLRYLNNERDPWGLVPIMADLGYSMVEIEAAMDSLRRETDRGYLVPREIRAQRGELYAHRRRITDLLSRIYSWYGLDNDITQTIITVLSTAHRDSLLTISDLITIIETDIESGTTYTVEADNRSDAVIVMTMHKSKGLEFPAVIIPYVDQKSFPKYNRSDEAFVLDDLTGLRSRRTVGHFDDYSKICRSWRVRLVERALPKDYDEEKRLLFVAMSRAEQYVTLIHGDNPSPFIKGLMEAGLPEVDVKGCYFDPSDAGSETIDMPDVSRYRPRPRAIGVHGVMRFDAEDGMGGMTETDESPGKGKEYGTKVHDEARWLEHGGRPSGEFPESEYILDRVLSRRDMDGFVRSDSEIDIVIPVEEGGFVLRGIMDLLLQFGDRMEIHDYKTDVSDRFQREYEIQLSVYAMGVGMCYPGRPVRCFIDYVSQGRTVEFEPIPRERLLDVILPRAKEWFDRMTVRRVRRTSKIHGQ